MSRFRRWLAARSEVAEKPSDAPERPAALPPVVTGPAAPGAGEPAAGLHWLRVFASVVGPVTILTALLYYYGYVTTFAEFAYFGIDVELLDLSTPDYVLRSPASLFLPLLGLLLLAALGGWLHSVVWRWSTSGRHQRGLGVASFVTLLLGVALVLRGLYGILDGRVSSEELVGVSPASLGLGTILMLYGLQVRRWRDPPGPASQRNTWNLVASWTIGWSLVVLSLFWLVNSFAGAYGRGQASRLQADLVDQDEVVLHTRSRLFVDDRGVDPSQLCERTIDDRDFRYRYLNLRLLAVSDDSLFLVPATWSPEQGVVIVVARNDVRTQYLRGQGLYRCPTP